MLSSVHIFFTEPLIFRPSHAQIIGPSLHTAIYKGLGEGPEHYRAVLLKHESLLVQRLPVVVSTSQAPPSQSLASIQSLVASSANTK